MNKKLFAVLLCLVMVFTLVPATTWAYVGAMNQNPGVTAGVENGYYYLKSDYLNFWLDPSGWASYTLPAAKDLNYAKANGYTEVQQLMCNGSYLLRSSTTISIITSSEYSDGEFNLAGAPMLEVEYTFKDSPLTARIVYRMVQVDDGGTEGTTPWFLSDTRNDSDNWGIIATTFYYVDRNNVSPSQYGEYKIRWQTWHNNFGKVGHTEQGSVLLSKYSTDAYDYPRRGRVCQDDFCKFSKFKYLSAEISPNISCLHIS